jgi:hypothetical protein
MDRAPTSRCEETVNWKSVWAVVAGALAAIILTTLVDILLHSAGVYPRIDQPISDSLAALATAYRIVIGIGGAYLTARLAPSNPMKHALILGAIGGIIALIGVFATWNKNLGPHWYPIALVVLAIPQCWLGAKLFESRGSSVAQHA